MKLFIVIFNSLLVFDVSFAETVQALKIQDYTVIGKCSGPPKILKGQGFIYFLGQRDPHTNVVNLETIRVVSEIAVADEDLAQDYLPCSYPNFNKQLAFPTVPAKVNQKGWEATWIHPIRGEESSGHLQLGATSLKINQTNSTWSNNVPSYASCAFGLNLN